VAISVSLLSAIVKARTWAPGQMIKAEGRHFGNAALTAGEQPAVPGDDVEIGIDQNRHNEAKTLYTFSNLPDLLLAVPAWVAWIGLQSLDLSSDDRQIKDLFSLNPAPRSNISRISKYSSVDVCDRATSCCLLRCRGTISSEPSRDQALLSLGALAQPSALQGNLHPSKNKQTDDYLLIIGDGAAGLLVQMVGAPDPRSADRSTHRPRLVRPGQAGPRFPS
jgi:hypothetical protein